MVRFVPAPVADVTLGISSQPTPDEQRVSPDAAEVPGGGDTAASLPARCLRRFIAILGRGWRASGILASASVGPAGPG